MARLDVRLADRYRLGQGEHGFADLVLGEATWADLAPVTVDEPG